MYHGTMGVLNIRRLVFLIIPVVLLLAGVQQSYSQEKSAAEPCENGIKLCEKLKGKKEKYSRCLELACTKSKSTEVPEKAAEEERKTCELGLRKCNSLRDEYDYYWSCMDDTCKNPAAENNNPSCEKGHEQCKPRLDEYRMCVNLICKNPVGDYRECDKGKDSCAESLRRYWTCVSNVCLGDVSKYRVPKQNVPTTAAEKKAFGEGVRSAKEGFKYAPEGVSQKEWERHLPPDNRILQGNGEGQIACRRKEASMSCNSRDIRSCTCSDGSYPELVKK